MSKVVILFVCWIIRSNRGDPMWAGDDFYRSDEDCPPLDLDKIFDGREVPEQLRSTPHHTVDIHHPRAMNTKEFIKAVDAAVQDITDSGKGTTIITRCICTIV